MGSGNEQGLKPRILKVSVLGSGIAQRTLRLLLEKKAGQTAYRHTAWKHQISRVPGAPSVKISCSSWRLSQRGNIQGDPTRNTEAGRHHFSPLPLSLSTEPPAEPAQRPHSILNPYTKPHPQHFCATTLPSHTFVRVEGPLPQKTSPNPCQHCLLTQECCKSSVPAAEATSLISEADHSTPR